MEDKNLKKSSGHYESDYAVGFAQLSSRSDKNNGDRTCVKAFVNGMKKISFEDATWVL